MCVCRCKEDKRVPVLTLPRLLSQDTEVRLTTEPLAGLDLAAATDEEVIRSFAKLESLKPGKVNMALDKLLEDRQNEKTLLSGHGAK